MRLLYAEDERDLNEVVTRTLLKNHYSVDSCFDGEEALDCLAAAEYDAVILDIMMPRVDGLTVLSRLRARGNRVPVLLLTARDGVSDRVKGLDSGADDYLVKPFALEELLARVRALLRRDAGRADNCYRLADLTVDCDARTRDKIEQHIWNYDYAGGSNVVDVYIRYLRKKIDDGFSPKLIHTVRGAGYVLREQP